MTALTCGLNVFARPAQENMFSMPARLCVQQQEIKNLPSFGSDFSAYVKEGHQNKSYRVWTLDVTLPSIQEKQMEKDADMDVNDEVMTMNDNNDDDAQDSQCVDTAGIIKTKKELEVAMDQKQDDEASEGVGFMQTVMLAKEESVRNAPSDSYSSGF